MGVILDTTAVIGLLELEHDRPFLIDAIRDEGGPDLPAILVVTLGELAAGVEAARNEPARAAARQRALQVASGANVRRRFDVLPIDPATWQTFGQISGALSRKLGHNDKWIASAALATGRTLLTQDATLAEHASSVPHLRVRHVVRQG